MWLRIIWVPYRDIRPHQNRMSSVWQTIFDDEAPVLEIKGTCNTFSFSLLPGPLTRSGSTVYSPIYESNRYVQKIFVFDKTVNVKRKKI